MWNNLQDGPDETEQLQDDEDSTSTVSNCLFGTADTMFVAQVAPEFAPRINGDFRLKAGSPAIDAGDGANGASANTSTTDLAGEPRFDGIIDVGAYEGIGGDTFAGLFPALTPEGDENGNGLSNFTYYAIGNDPTTPAPTSPGASLDGDLLTFLSRAGTIDVLPAFQKSGDLDDWMPMVEGVDYTVESTYTEGNQIRAVIRLTVSPASGAAYFRQLFSDL